MREHNHGESDKRLVDGLNEGSESAFGQLFNKYYAPLCEYASIYISKGDAEDLVQNFMVRLWEGRTTLRIEGALKSYLFVAVRNRCLNAIRDRQYKQTVQQFIYDRLKNEFETPDRMILSDMQTQITQAIESLPENYRHVFEMSRFDCTSNREIATQLGVSVKAVEYYITQSIKILRVKLKDYLCSLLC